MGRASSGASVDKNQLLGVKAERVAGVERIALWDRLEFERALKMDVLKTLFRSFIYLPVHLPAVGLRAYFQPVASA